MTRYCSNEDIQITIQVLKVVLSKIGKFKRVNTKIAPSINRVIMELEELD